MFCRSSKLVHAASGVTLNTPLLVPSFSNKAFGFTRGGQPEILRVLDASREFITRTCLISAYDVFYEYLPQPEDLAITVDLMFVDSGGYEVSQDRDLSAVDKPVHRPKEWDAGKLAKILGCWPEGLPAVFVGYDHPNERRPVEEQVRAAKEFLSRYPKHLHSFLLKPQTQEEQSLESALEALKPLIRDLDGFHLLGLTEKELGNSILERMVRIAKVRQGLDAAGLSLPIHVFGALDPLSVCLYFVAGAEVFDGLTWFRYAYNSGQCVYAHNNAALVYGIEVTDDEVRVRTIKENMRYMERLERSLREVAESGTLDGITEQKEFIQKAADQLRSRLGRDR